LFRRVASSARWLKRESPSLSFFCAGGFGGEEKAVAEGLSHQPINDPEEFNHHGEMAFNPSSTVKSAPHFGHFNLVSLLTIPAQPKENAVNTANARANLTIFFTSLYPLSFGIYFIK